MASECAAAADAVQQRRNESIGSENRAALRKRALRCHRNDFGFGPLVQAQSRAKMLKRLEDENVEMDFDDP